MRSLRDVIGIDECVLVLGLALIAYGFALMPSWAAGSALAPGGVLVWLSVPTRARFIQPGPVPDLPKKRSR